MIMCHRQYSTGRPLQGTAAAEERTQIAVTVLLVPGRAGGVGDGAYVYRPMVGYQGARVLEGREGAWLALVSIPNLL